MTEVKRIVPIEPTEDMYEAAVSAFNAGRYVHPLSPLCVRAIWGAMLDAARRAAPDAPEHPDDDITRFFTQKHPLMLEDELHAYVKRNEEAAKRREPIATVVNNNQPGWTNIVETAPNVTLNIGTKLYLCPAPAPDLLTALDACCEALRTYISKDGRSSANGALMRAYDIATAARKARGES